MNELRWILLGAAVVVLAWIYFQGRRKKFATNDFERPSRHTPRQAHGLSQDDRNEPKVRAREIEPPQLTESVIVRDERGDRHTGDRHTDGSRTVMPRIEANFIDNLPEVRIDTATSGSFSMPGTFSMNDALSTAALDQLTITQPLDSSATQPFAPSDMQSFERAKSASLEGIEAAASAVPAEPISTRRPTSAAATVPRTSRKIVALRVPAQSQRIGGARLKDVLLSQGLRHGRYDIFHRSDEAGNILFSVASMIEPGMFELASMATTEYPGVSLFLQLPSSVDGVQAFDAMFACAQVLQHEFLASLQGERGKPLTAETVARIREDIVNFQHLVPYLSGNT